MSSPSEAAARLREALESDVDNGPEDDNDLAVTVRDYLPALLVEVEARQWRAMDSAPRDGTWVLACSTVNYGRLPFVLRWTQWGWVDRTGCTREVSHWMPRPEVPHE